MIRGDKVYLVPIEREDLELLRTWRNQPNFRKYFREYREISKEMQEKWYEAKVLGDPSTIMFAIRRTKDDSLLGCCGLCYINWVHRNADLSLYIGYENAYIDNEGFAKEACQLMFAYGYDELGLRKIWTEIYEFDTPKFELYTELGFHQDGILRDQYFYEGRFWNSRMLSLLSDEFKR